MTLKIALLSSDTLHHRYFINRMKAEGLPLELVIFEKKIYKPKFKTSPFLEKDEEIFESREFKKLMNIDSVDCENLFVPDINCDDAISLLRSKKINYGIVFGTGLIKEKLINYFKGNLINIHRGIAEEYRGLDSDLWAIYHDDFNNIGVTIHKVDTELDTGDISYSKSLKLDKNMQIFQLRFYTTLLAYELVKKTLLDFINGDIKFSKQKKIGRYYSFMPIQLKKGLDNKFENYVTSEK